MTETVQSLLVNSHLNKNKQFILIGFNKIVYDFKKIVLICLILFKVNFAVKFVTHIWEIHNSGQNFYNLIYTYQNLRRIDSPTPHSKLQIVNRMYCNA